MLKKNKVLMNRTRTMKSCETILTIPSLSVKSSSFVKRLSRRECRRLFRKTVPTNHQHVQKRIRNTNWYSQSQFEVNCY